MGGEGCSEADARMTAADLVERLHQKELHDSWCNYYNSNDEKWCSCGKTIRHEAAARIVALEAQVAELEAKRQFRETEGEKSAQRWSNKCIDAENERDAALARCEQLSAAMRELEGCQAGCRRCQVIARRALAADPQGGKHE
jgi:hypothetical protein